MDGVEQETEGLPDASAGAVAVEAEPVAEKVDQAGGEQSSSDGSSVEGQQSRQRGKSVYSQVRELNAKLREQRSYWESEVGTLRQQLEEIRSQVGSRQATPKQGKTFWEAPEEILEERLSSHMSELEKRMQSTFEQTQAQREQAALRSQEVSEAAKFIRSQKGITEDDIADIREILQSNPNLNNLSPMDQAEFALYKWQKERGITDKSANKARASTTVGAPASVAGPRTWTEAQIEAEMSKFPSDVKSWTKEENEKFALLDREIQNAYREKRVTK